MPKVRGTGVCVSAAGWGRLQYESWDNEKVEAVGNRAWGAFLRAVAWSGYKRKDGWISAAAMRKIEPDTRVWDRLRAGGMLEPREDGAAALHGWSEHNETTVRRAEREESYSRRGKAGAATRWPDSNSHASTEAAPLETDERSRSRSRSEKRDQDHGDPRERGPFKDPAGIAPPGENPDAYPGSVTPQLELVPVAPKVSADQKTRTRKGTTKGPRPDIDPSTLSPEARAAYEAILAEPTFGPITVRPAEAARDFAVTYPRLDLAQAIREIGVQVRAKDRTYTNGAAALANWLPHSKCIRTTPIKAGPRTPEQIAELQRQGKWPLHPPPKHWTERETPEQFDARMQAEREESRRRGSFVPASAGALVEADRFGVFDDDDDGAGK